MNFSRATWFYVKTTLLENRLFTLLTDINIKLLDLLTQTLTQHISVIGDSNKGLTYRKSWVELNLCPKNGLFILEPYLFWRNIFRKSEKTVIVKSLWQILTRTLGKIYVCHRGFWQHHNFLEMLNRTKVMSKNRLLVLENKSFWGYIFICSLLTYIATKNRVHCLQICKLGT